MESPEIKDRLVNGVMDFEKHNYIWNAELPVPENSLYFRFQFKRTQVTDEPNMFTRKTSHNLGNYIYLNMGSRGYVSFKINNGYPWSAI